MEHRNQLEREGFDLKRDRRLERKEIRAQQVRSAAASNPDMPRAEIARRLGVRDEFVRAVLGKVHT